MREHLRNKKRKTPGIEAVRRNMMKSMAPKLEVNLKDLKQMKRMEQQLVPTLREKTTPPTVRNSLTIHKPT